MDGNSGSGIGLEFEIYSGYMALLSSIFTRLSWLGGFELDVITSSSSSSPSFVPIH